MIEVGARFGQRTWARTGVLAILDQGVFAGSHLVLNVALARWMSPEQYGQFAIVYALFLLAAAIHAGLVIEPVLVHGAAQYRTSLGSYLHVAQTVHWRFSAMLGSVLLLIGGVIYAVGDVQLGETAMAAGVLTPLILYMWLVRRAMYVVGRIRVAVVGGGVYGATLAAGLILLERAGILSPWTAFLLIGLGASLGALVIRRFLPTASGRGAGAGLGSTQDFRDVAVRAGLVYGRWAAAAQVLSWVIINGFYVLVGAFASVSAAGALRAVMNLFLPIQHVVIGIAAALLPQMSGRFQGDGPSGVVHEAQTVAKFLTPIAIAYSLALVALGPLLLDVLYAGRYDEYAVWILYLLPLPLLWVGTSLLENALRAVGSPNRVFAAFGVSGALLFGGIAIAAPFGIRPALVVWSVSLLGGLVVMLHSLLSVIKGPRHDA